MRTLFVSLTFILCSNLFASNWKHSFFETEPPVLSSMSEGNITKTQFKTLLKKIKKAYTKRVHQNGGLFKVKGKWNSKRVNAYASRVGPIWKLTALGGLARHPMIDYDGFAIVLCHEMGHHLGGAPKSTVYFKRWVSYEGQADYWATLKCFRTLFRDEDNVGYLEQNLDRIPLWGSLKCLSVYKNAQRSALCIRSIMAGQTMANLIADYHNTDFPSLETPDPEVVESTSYQHPNSQCRLDTYAMGALCPTEESDYVDSVDPDIGTCNRQAGDSQGTRPLCWYRPE